MLTFDEQAHVYKWNDQVVPSVTQILKHRGFIDDRWFTEESRQRGTSVHVACHYLDEEDLDWETVDPKIIPYIDAYKKFKEDTGFIPIKIEEMLFNKHCFYAGTLDRVGLITIPKQKEVLIDFKTGSVESWVGLQLAGYNLCLKQRLPRYALQLKNDGTYRLRHFDDPSDHDMFQYQASTYHWLGNQKHGGKNARTDNSYGELYFAA